MILHGFRPFTLLALRLEGSDNWNSIPCAKACSRTRARWQRRRPRAELKMPRLA